MSGLRTRRACAGLVVGFLAISFVVAGEISFHDRVEAQLAIDRVYLAHRVGPTRPFDRTISRESLERRVRTYLEQSAALEQSGALTITADVLRRELERIASRTHFPDRLAAIYAALGHDSVLIQECLARPALVRRLASRLTGSESWEAWSERTKLSLPIVPVETAAEPLPEIPRPLGRGAATGSPLEDACPTDEGWNNGILDYLDLATTFGFLTHVFWTGDAMVYLNSVANYGVSYDPLLDVWTDISMIDGPGSREDFTAIWTGSEIIVWGGSLLSGGQLNTGARYDPALDSWTPTSTIDPPLAREHHTAVWADDRMIVYGGSNVTNGQMKNGHEYDPLTDIWTASTFNPNGQGRREHLAVWIGNEMIVWGGFVGESAVNTGARYDPVARSWSVVNEFDAPSPRTETTGVAIDGELIVWGGRGTDFGPDGSRYDPTDDSWTPLASGGPSSRWRHLALAAGHEMVIWGGVSQSGGDREYFRYDTTLDSWSTINEAGGPPDYTRPVWTGDELFVWNEVAGARYDPSTDTWSVMGGVNAPPGGIDPTSVWTGNEMIVWGGRKGAPGGRYDPLLDAWFVIPTTGAPGAYRQLTSVWTGSEMIVWGGVVDPDGTNEGARYDPLTDSWTPTSTLNAPQARHDHSAVWTGEEMIVWGGDASPGTIVVTGGRYDPDTDSWLPLTTVGAPEARRAHRAVWTGREMIVWGGRTAVGPVYLSSGGRYDPVADAWSQTSDAGVPDGRHDFSAVWSGDEMIVWGGSNSTITQFDTGGRYDPRTDAWQPVSLVAAPAARQRHAAVWTGAEMLVWGGSPADDGHAYDPVADAWTPLLSGDEPARRFDPTAVWTGEEMIVWGGQFQSSGGIYRVPDIDRDGLCNVEDNCPGRDNAGQDDADADGAGDACDNCAATPNPGQADADRDGTGNACDACPLDAEDDGDADGLCADVDACPADADNDLDADGQCGDADCDATDPNDRRPPDVALLAGRPAPGVIELSWAPATGADSYSLTRGDLAELVFGHYGSCTIDGLVETSYADADVPATGEALVYLVQGVSDDCGPGDLGLDASGRDRAHWSGSVCAGPPVTDSFATAETTVFGEVLGGFAETLVADDAAQSIVEEVTTGSPASRISRLDHRWTIESVPAGGRLELHVEGFRSDSVDGDAFLFEYSTDGGVGWNPLVLVLPLVDDDIDRKADLAPGLSGTILVRVTDTDRMPGNGAADTLSVDQLFIRSVP